MTFPKTNKDILSFLLHETLYYYTSPLNPKQSPNPTLENQFPKTFPSILSFSSSPFYLPRSNKTFFDRREERGWGEGGVFDRTADKSIPRRAISWFLPSLSLSSVCVCVTRGKEKEQMEVQGFEMVEGGHFHLAECNRHGKAARRGFSISGWV